MIRPGGMFGGSLALAAAAAMVTQRPDVVTTNLDPAPASPPEPPKRGVQSNNMVEPFAPFASRCRRDKPGGRAALRRQRQRERLAVSVTLTLSQYAAFLEAKPKSQKVDVRVEGGRVVVTAPVSQGDDQERTA